jgi:hypothetical protein
MYNDRKMKKIRTVGLIALCILTSTILVGCTSVSVPPARTYTVWAGGTEFAAKSMKIHGSWAELETDLGPVWASGVVIRPMK